MLEEIKKGICLKYNILGVDEDSSTISVEFENPYSDKGSENSNPSYTRDIPITLNDNGDLDETALYTTICELSFGIKAKMDLALSKDSGKSLKKKAHADAIKKFGRKPKPEAKNPPETDAPDVSQKGNRKAGATKPKKVK